MCIGARRCDKVSARSAHPKKGDLTKRHNRQQRIWVLNYLDAENIGGVVPASANAARRPSTHGRSSRNSREISTLARRSKIKIPCCQCALKAHRDHWPCLAASRCMHSLSACCVGSTVWRGAAGRVLHMEVRFVALSHAPKHAQEATRCCARGEKAGPDETCALDYRCYAGRSRRFHAMVARASCATPCDTDASCAERVAQADRDF